MDIVHYAITVVIVDPVQGAKDRVGTVIANVTGIRAVFARTMIGGKDKMMTDFLYSAGDISGTLLLLTYF